MKKRNTSGNGHLKQCITCGNACCKYFTVEIDTPRSILDFDNLLWRMVHENTNVFKDAGGWYVLVYTPCKHLKKNGECAIYERRPYTCREHSSQECEFEATIPDTAELYFEDDRSLEDYCRKRFKTWDKRYERRI